MHNFDRVANIYDSTRGLPEPAMTAVLDALTAELHGSGRVLDAGVGTGRFAGPLVERGFDVVGVDVSQAMLSVARNKPVGSLVRGELTTMPFADKAFDSCLMIHILHLVESPAGLLSEVTRVCRSKVLSLAETSDGASIRENYIKFMTEMGYPWSELTEQKLTTVVAPTELKDVISYTVEMKMDDEIDYFRDRLSAVTWDVPNDAHNRIISRLSSMMGGKVCRFSRTIKLAVWDVERIDSAARTLTR